MIKFENVSFVEANVTKAKKEEFISANLNVFWRDRNEATRKKMLAQAYDLCAGTKKTK